MQMTFFDALHGFIRLSSDAVYGTSDGGATWTSVGQETHIIGFQAASMSDLWAFPLGSNGGWSTGGIVRSTNGGVTWTNVSTVPSFRAQGLALLDPQHVWVEGVICASPISTPSPSVPPKPQPCRDARSVLLRSSDGGSTWQTIDLPSLPDSIMFVSPSVGYGMTSQLLITRDGGVTWRPVKYSLRP